MIELSEINGDMIVEKSRFLLGMKAPSYELGELKVLDTYLARINARDPETKLVKFTKAEYEQLMGLKQIKPQLLKKNTQALLGKVVTIPYGDNGYDQYTLFTHARCRKDPETFEWLVELGCNEKLEPIFFNLESVGYLRYRLKNIVPLTSKYSVMLYLYFKDNIFRQTFEISLKELREKLGVEDNKTYESFKYFKRDIIDKCVAEINKNTDIHISYERKTRGRLTIGLVFTVKGKASSFVDETVANNQKDLPEPVDLPGQMNFDDLAAAQETSEPEHKNQYSNSGLEYLAEAVNYEFNEAEISEIEKILNTLPSLVDGLDDNFSPEMYQFYKAKAFKDYLELKYAGLNARAARTDQPPIRNRFSYFKTLLKAVSEPSEESKSSYDMDAFNKKANELPVYKR